MPGQLRAAAGGGCAGRQGGFLDRQARGLCSSPRPSPLLPPSSSSLAKCEPAPRQRALQHLVELCFKSGDGNTKAWRLVSVFENSIFAVLRMEADIPYMLHRVQVLHQSTVLRVGYGTHKHMLTGSGIDTAPGFSFVPVVNVYFIAR